MLKNKNKKVVMIVVALFLVAPVVNLVVNAQVAQGVPSACDNSKECQEAVKNEKVAKEKAEQAADNASAYKVKVEELTAEISGKEAEIAQTEQDVKDLRKEIEQTEVKLGENQEALAELLVNMHFESDAEPIRVLAGATSISDLAEKAAREETVKQQISDTANEIKDMKAQLEADKTKVEELLIAQRNARTALVNKRAEHKALIEKYENDVESYTEIAKEEAKKRQAAIEAEIEQHPELYGGNTYVGNGTNNYPWAGVCPAQQDAYGTIRDGHYIGGYVCECVSYAGWKAYDAYGLVIAWGNAYNWDNRARAAGYTVDHNPAAGTIGQIDNGPYGHVFWVESINSNGSVNITEYNNPYSTQLYSGAYHAGDFGARTISASEAKNYNYIHLR